MPAPVLIFDLLRAVRDEMTGTAAVITMTVDENGIWVEARGGGHSMRLGLRRDRYLAMELADSVAWAAVYRRQWDASQPNSVPPAATPAATPPPASSEPLPPRPRGSGPRRR